MPGFADLRHIIRSTTHDALEGLVVDLLTGLIPRVARSRRLGAVDCLGIDVSQYDESTDAITMAIQCKGFELAIGEQQVETCLVEIQKFKRVGPTVASYWLIVNKRMGQADRAMLEPHLDDLVASGKATEAKLLDLNTFVDQLRTLARDRLAAWATEARERLRAEFVERLEVVRYVADVPFEHRGVSRDGPVDWTNKAIRQYLDAIHEEHVGKDRSPPRFLFTASFGFGKTSTLHAIAEDWIASAGNVIYVPAALLSDEAFVNGAGLTKSLLDQITPPRWEAPQHVLFTLRETLRKELARSREWVLLIDGLDECAHWPDPQRMSALWGGVVDLGLPLVASVRDELFQLRRQEFEAGDGRTFGRPFFEPMALSDWPDPLIDEFLQRYEAAQSSPPPAAFERFRQLVRSGAYVSIYGDIPRRPLFLGMLADDAWRDAEPERELHRLYGKYLRRKLYLDRHSAGAAAVVRTGELAIRLGREEEGERLILAMQDVAGEIAAAGLRDEAAVIAEDRLRQILSLVSAEVARIEEIALNSLLLPAGRDPASRQRLFRFAHQSFQDWFVARWLAMTATPLNPNIHNDAVREFVARMSADLAAGGELP
jgi:hypothetical protein